MTAVVVLGMHRSGTSCLAGMLAAAGIASSGKAVRNWDNARGHHELLDVVRLNEAVLSASGGHWLQAPPDVRWTDEHAQQRDRLLSSLIDDRPALLKDPRTLLVLPFWRASKVPFHVVGIVRHPLSVARSLESWRAMPLEASIALWTAHNRVLLADQALHHYPILNFEAPRATVIEATEQFCTTLETPFDASALAAAYEEQLVHHDSAEEPSVAGLEEAIALFQQLTGTLGSVSRARFPRAELSSFEQLVRARRFDQAVLSARAAIDHVVDVAAVLVPVVNVLAKQQAYTEALELVSACEGKLDEGLAALLLGKLHLLKGDAVVATVHLERACAVPKPFFQARLLLPQALRGARRNTEARAALRATAKEALYPHGPLATLAEWSWSDGARKEALVEMEQAIEAAPKHRRGRLRSRRAEWLLVLGEVSLARAELEEALREDPQYQRCAELLAKIPAAR